MMVKKSSYWLLSTITGLLCLLAITFSTPWGTQFSLILASKISPIQTDYHSGTLLNNLQLNTLDYKNDAFEINAKNLRIFLHLRCLWKKQLCVDELSSSSLVVTIKQQNTKEIALEGIERNDITDFIFPFSIDVKRLAVKRGKFTNSAVNIALKEFSSDVLIHKNSLTTNNASVASINVDLLNNDNELTPKDSQKARSIRQEWPLSNLPTIKLPITLAVKSFKVNDVLINNLDSSSDENIYHHVKNIFVKLSWINELLSVQQFSASIPSIGDVSLNGNTRFIAPYQVNINIYNDVNNNAWLPQINHSKLSLALSGDLSDLAVNLSSQGALVFNSESTINLLDENLPYSTFVDAAKFTLPTELNSLINPSSLTLKSQGDINTQSLELTSKLSGYGYNDAALELNITHQNKSLEIHALKVTEPKGENHLLIKGELTLKAQKSWDLEFHSTGLTLPPWHNQISGRVQGDISSKGFWNEKEWSIKITDSHVSGEINNRELNAKVDVDIDHLGKLLPSEIAVTYGESNLWLKGCNDDSWHISGLMNVGQTSTFLAGVKGSLTTDFSVSGLLSQPELNLTGAFKNFDVNALMSDEIMVSAKYSPFNNHKHQLSINSPEVHWENVNVTSLQFSSIGDLTDQQLNLSWLGSSSINLLIDGHYSSLDEQWTTLIENPLLTLGERKFQAENPIKAVFSLANKSLDINQHCWLSVDFELCLKNNVALNQNNGTVSLALESSTEIFKPLLPEDVNVSSNFSGLFSIDWQQGDLATVNANFSISEGSMQLNENGTLNKLFDWQKGNVDFKLDEDTIKFNLALISSSNHEIVNASALYSLTEQQILDGNLLLNAYDISPLIVFLPQLSDLQGHLNSQLTFKGELDTLSINGGIALSGANAKVVGDSNIIEDIAIDLNFNGQQASVAGGVLINQGVADLKGQVTWQDVFQANVNIAGDSLHFLLPPNLNLHFSPKLNLKVTPSELKLSGEVVVEKGKLSLNQLPQGSVGLSKDVIMLNEEGEQIVSEKIMGISTDVRLIIADKFQVEGQGFEGRLGGELHVSQQAHQPLQLFGSMNFPEGRYRAYGQNLSIAKGSVSFNGSTENPYIAIQAIRTIEKEDIIVGIDASGLANSLQVKLFSNPTMQQSETLSYLIRGRGLDAKTSDGNAALGMALGTALTNYSGVLTELEKLPLLSNIEIEGDENQAALSGYIGDKVYIKYGIGIVEPINELTVRFYLLNRLWIEAVSKLENSVDVYYSFDID